MNKAILGKASVLNCYLLHNTIYSNYFTFPVSLILFLQVRRVLFVCILRAVKTRRLGGKNTKNWEKKYRSTQDNNNRFSEKY